jgi:hypothetical protein
LSYAVHAIPAAAVVTGDGEEQQGKHGNTGYIWYIRIKYGGLALANSVFIRTVLIRRGKYNYVSGEPFIYLPWSWHVCRVSTLF